MKNEKPTDEKLKQWDSHIVQSVKTVRAVDGRIYRVSANLQFFFDENGVLQWVREV